MASPFPPRIAVLDDWSGIVAQKQFSEYITGVQLDLYPDTLNPEDPVQLEKLVQRLEPYTIISTLRERTAFQKVLLSRLPNLKLLLNAGTRNQGIDMEFATAKGVIVTGANADIPTEPAERAAIERLSSELPPGSYSNVNQHSWALLLALCSRIPAEDRGVKTPGTLNWQVTGGLGISLGGKSLGVVGLGKLGLAMAKTAVGAFGMKVLAWSENLTQEKADAAAVGAGLEKGVFKVVSKEALFKESDVVSLHYVLSERSRGLVGEQELEWMKKRAILLNTSRGGLIDEQVLIEALRQGKIEGAALDVFWVEPLPEDSLWRRVDEWSKSTVVLAPHTGYAFEGHLHRFYQQQALEVIRYLRGEKPLLRMN